MSDEHTTAATNGTERRLTDEELFPFDVLVFVVGTAVCDRWMQAQPPERSYTPVRQIFTEIVGRPPTEEEGRIGLNIAELLREGRKSQRGRATSASTVPGTTGSAMPPSQAQGTRPGRQPRGACPRCHRDVALRDNGSLREHRVREGQHQPLCDWSGKMPQEGTVRYFDAS